MINVLSVMCDMNSEIEHRHTVFFEPQQTSPDLLGHQGFLICQPRYLKRKGAYIVRLVLHSQTDSSFPLSLHFPQRALINREFNNSVLYNNSLPSYQTQSDCGWIKWPFVAHSDSWRGLSMQGVTPVLLSWCVCTCVRIQIVV